MKCFKFLRSRLCLRYLSLFLSCFMFLSSTIGIRAESVTATPTPNEYVGQWTMNTTDYLEMFWDTTVRQLASWYVIGSDAIFGTFTDFYEWLRGDPNYGVLEQYPNTIIHSPVPPTGNEYIDVSNSDSIDIPVPVQNTILEFVQYNVNANPLTYTECYVHSYNYLDPTYFLSYNTYKYVQELIKNNNGYTFISAPNGWNGNNNNALWIMLVPRSYNLSFIGTANSGIFTNVGLAHDWTQLQSLPVGTEGIQYIYVNQAGAHEDLPSSHRQYWSPVKNLSSPQQTGSCVFTNYEDDELVYCFTTIQALRNYNSGVPQTYYLTSEGLENGTWTVSGSGSINTGTMNNSGNYYSSVTNGVGVNWTPEQILALVDKVSGNGNGSGGGSGGGGSGSDNTHIWSAIGEAIGSLITGIATVVSKVAEALSNAILSIINIFVGDDGLFAKLTDLVDTGFQNFLSGVFSWMPPEIVTLFSATLIFGIFFAIWKMLRG